MHEGKILRDDSTDSILKDKEVKHLLGGE